MPTRHLDRNDVPAQLRQGYDGRKFVAQITGAVTIPATAGLWDGGSRDTYSAVQLATGATVAMPDADPFNGAQRDRRIDIPAGVAIVRRSVFQGRDSGLTFYIRPEDAAPLLPPPAAELDDVARITLETVAHYKPAYRLERARDKGLSGADYEAAKARLITSGHLNAAGAITTTGRNAL